MWLLYRYLPGAKNHRQLQYSWLATSSDKENVTAEAEDTPPIHLMSNLRIQGKGSDKPTDGESATVEDRRALNVTQRRRPALRTRNKQKACDTVDKTPLVCEEDKARSTSSDARIRRALRNIQECEEYAHLLFRCVFLSHNSLCS